MPYKITQCYLPPGTGDISTIQSQFHIAQDSVRQMTPYVKAKQKCGKPDQDGCQQ